MSRLLEAPRAVAVLALAAATLALVPLPASGQDAGADPAQACPVTVAPAGFVDRGDIAAAHVHNVDCAARFHIALGFADRTFRPHLPVRRDQMASFIARTLDAAHVDLPPAEQGRVFADVAADNPHRHNIRRLEAAGIVAGGPLGRGADEYGPQLPTRRDQMASMLDRAATMAFLGLPPQASAAAGDHESSQSARFADVPAGNVHATHIDQAAAAGLVVGFADGTFRPAVHTRRDHMASFVTRLLRFLTVPLSLRISDQPAQEANVGETVTVTATVFTQFGTQVGPDVCATPGQDVRFFNSRVCTVTFQTDQGEPARTAVEPDADGHARFAFTATAPGTVTVTASIRGPGGLFRDPDGDTDSAQVVFWADR